MDNYIDDLKMKIPIDQVVRKDEPLEQATGKKFLRGSRSDSLVVDTRKGVYHWNSKNESGDIIEWVMRRRGFDFKSAVEELAREFGVQAPSWSKEDLADRIAARRIEDTTTVAVKMMHRNLLNNETALSYCHGRGWTDETISECMIGYWNGNSEALRGEFSMYGIDQQSAAAQALLKMPRGGDYGYIIYPHLEHGRPVYVSLRICYTGKKKELPKEILAHYNIPSEAFGERRPFWNLESMGRTGRVVVVEGQADAITLNQWGIAAVALAGVRVGNTQEGQALLRQLAQLQVYVGLDQDDAGAIGARALAETLGPQIRVVRWPDHDANDWLKNNPMEASAMNAAKLISAAPTYVEVYAQRVSGLEGQDKEKALLEFFGMIARLTQFQRDVLREKLLELSGLKSREYDKLLKGVLKETEGGAGGDDPAVVLQIVGGMIEGHLVETLYQPAEGGAGSSATGGARTMLAVKTPDGKIITRPHLDINGIRYSPPSPTNPILVESVVRFAPEIGESRTMRELVREIQATIHKYMDLDVFYETLAAYYVVFTWLYDSFNTLAYLRVLGDAGTGKSRFLQTVGSLCYRPITVTGAATTSPIFRLLDRYRGTLVMDEADFGKSDEAADIVKIFNTGYQRSQGIVLRAGAKENNFEPEVFLCYGPKVIATRKKFEDWALESRCLTKETGGPTTRSDIPIEIPREFWTVEVPRIQSLLLRYRLENWQPSIELKFDRLEGSIEPRLNQVLVALVSIVDDEDLLGDLKTFQKKYNEQLIAERGMTLASKVLEAVVAQAEIEKSKPEAQRDMTVNTIAGLVNDLINFENLDEDEEYEGKGVTSKKVGDVARKQLQLQTSRSSTHKGRYQVVLNEARIDGLRKRYGLDEERLETVIKTIIEVQSKREDKKSQAAQSSQRAFGG
jgi:DNA primase